MDLESGRSSPNPICGQAVRTQFGRPNSGVVQNLLVPGYTSMRKQPACEGRISTGKVFCAGGGEPPRVKLAGAEAVPGPYQAHMWTAPSLQGVLQCFDQIACVHMSGLT